MLPNDSYKIPDGNRFAYVVVTPRVQTLFTISAHRVSGDGDYRDGRKLVIRLQAPRELPAVHTRKPHIQENQIRSDSLCLSQAFLPGLRMNQFMRVLKGIFDQIKVVLGIFNNENRTHM